MDKHKKSNENNLKIEDKNLSVNNLLSTNQKDSLTCCYLEGLDLETLPEDFFYQLPNLRWLDLRNNKLTNIPTSITNHIYLETILLQNNKLSHLPLYLGTLKNLRCLQFRGNPITFPKQNILKQGTKYTLQYLSDLYESNDAKILENICQSTISKPENKNKNKKTSWDSSRRIFQFQIKSARDRCKLGEKCERSIWKSNSEKYLKPTIVHREIQDLKIRDTIFKEDLLQKKKELLGKREKMLQDRKSLEALKHWRSDYEECKSNNTHIYYALNLANLPYDTDLEFVKILTRADIEKDLPDKYVKNIKRTQSVTKNHPKSIVKGEEIEMKITDLLQTLQTENNKFVNCTPRSEKNIAINEIKRLTMLQKQIVNLKIANYGT